MISEITNDKLKEGNNLSEIISDLLVKFKKIKIDYLFLYKLLENSTESILFSDEKNNVTEMIQILGFPYSDITLKWKEVKIEKNIINIDFTDNLISINYPNISNIKVGDKIIKITTKRK